MVLANDELYQYASKEKRVHEKLYILNGVFTSTGQKEEIMHCNKIQKLYPLEIQISNSVVKMYLESPDIQR